MHPERWVQARGDSARDRTPGLFPARARARLRSIPCPTDPLRPRRCPMPPADVPPAVLDELRKYDTPTICNVLELFEHRSRVSGYFDGRIKACYPQLPPMVGFAFTA